MSFKVKCNLSKVESLSNIVGSDPSSGSSDPFADVYSASSGDSGKYNGKLGMARTCFDNLMSRIVPPVTVMPDEKDFIGNPEGKAAAMRSYNNNVLLAENINTAKATAKTEFNTSIEQPVIALLEKIKKEYAKIATFLDEVKVSAETFNNTEVWLKDAFDEMGYTSDKLLELGIEIQGGGETEPEVIMFTFTDVDGKDVTIPLAEAVNAFYTYTGTSIQAAIAFQLVLGEDISPEDAKYMLNNLIKSNYSRLCSDAKTGIYGVTSEKAIAAAYLSTNATLAEKYKDSTEDDADVVSSVIKQMNAEYAANAEKIEDNDIVEKLGLKNAEGTGSFIGAAGAIVASTILEATDDDGKKAYNFSNKLTEKLTDSEKEKVKLENDSNIKSNEESIAENDKKIEELQMEKEEGTDAEQLQQDAAAQQSAANGAAPVPPVGGVPPATGGMPNGQIPPDSSVPDGFEQLDPNGPIDPNNPNGDLDVGLSDQEANDIRDQMADIGDDESLGNVEADKPTSSDIDKAAKDEYFEKNEDYIDQRVEDIDRYSSMSIEEKQQALQDLGYSAEDAAELAGNDELGITAYLSGKQNNDLADISNDIAADQGVSGHDTSYDDNNNIGYVQSGEANVDLKGPSKEIHAAREQLDDAKLTYDNTVTSANAAIDRANVAKQNYDVVVNDITSKSGTDPKKWSEADVNRYNNAAKDYNKAVGEANEATKKVDSAKENYNKSKKEYNDTYDKWKKESQEEVKEAQDSLTDPDNTDLNGVNKPVDKPIPKPEEKPAPSEGNGGNSSDKPEVSGDGGSLELGDGEATGGQGEEKPQVIVPEGNGTDDEVVEGNGDTPTGHDDGFSSITNDETGKSTSAQTSEDVNPGGDTITSDDLSGKPTGGNPVDEKPVDNYVPDDFTDMN